MAFDIKALGFAEIHQRFCVDSQLTSQLINTDLIR